MYIKLEDASNAILFYTTFLAILGSPKYNRKIKEYGVARHISYESEQGCKIMSRQKEQIGESRALEGING